jgi:hypothetical protein
MVISLQLFGIDVLNFYLGQPPRMEQGVYVQNTGGNFEIAPDEVEYEEEEDRAKFGFNARRA